MTDGPGVGFGVAAALVHGLGFVLYARRMASGEIEPNGVSWLMRGYGTVVLFVIWSGVGVPPALLLHSAVSGLAALGIAFYGLRGGRCVPPCRQDYVILTGDIALLATYLALVGTGRHLSMASLVLAVTAIRKLAPYWPILRSTYQRPRRERPGAWLIWAAGYALLGLAVVEAGLPGVLGAYAGVMVAVHLGLALLALRAAGAPGGAAASSAGPASGGGARAGAALPAHAPSRL